MVALVIAELPDHDLEFFNSWQDGMRAIASEQAQAVVLLRPVSVEQISSRPTIAARSAEEHSTSIRSRGRADRPFAQLPANARFSFRRSETSCPPNRRGRAGSHPLDYRRRVRGPLCRPVCGPPASPSPDHDGPAGHQRPDALGHPDHRSGPGAAPTRLDGRLDHSREVGSLPCRASPIPSAWRRGAGATGAPEPPPPGRGVTVSWDGASWSEPSVYFPGRRLPGPSPLPCCPPSRARRGRRAPSSMAPATSAPVTAPTGPIRPR